MAIGVYSHTATLRAALSKNPCNVGLVPTMGALHVGHMSLIERSARDKGHGDGCTVVSIFVNPIQFDDHADLNTYPRTLSADLRLCEEAGADIVFAPSADEMYPEGFSTFVDIEDRIKNRMCGRVRPEHFRGVLTVVSKLFHIVKPARAYFGEKDAQQLFLLKKMVRDLGIDVRVIGCPTVREADGLALSSRNAHLSAEERRAALCLVRALSEARAKLGAPREPSPLHSAEVGSAPVHRVSGEQIESALSSMTSMIESEPLARMEYAEILDTDTFGEVTAQTRRILLAVAAHFGQTRLIDNMTVRIAHSEEEGSA